MSLNRSSENTPRVSGTFLHTVSSQCSSAFSTVILYPIDVVRMRYMSQDGTRYRQHNGLTYHSLRKSFYIIYRQEGVAAFFRGCHVAVLGSVCAWGIYMFLYRCLCLCYCSDWSGIFELNSNKKYNSLSHSYCSLDTFVQRSGISILASSLCAVACNPIWLVKTRMQVEEMRALQLAARGRSPPLPLPRRTFRTFCGSIGYTVQTTGFFSLWRGVSAQVLLGIPNAFNLPLYDTVKSYTLRYARKDQLPVGYVCACSTITKVLLSFVTHPIAVLKARLQDHRARIGEVQYHYFGQSLRTVWVRGGLHDLYRGMVPSLCHSVPRSVLMFVFYEQFLRLFSGNAVLSC